jgi:hypothetical protein
VTFSATGAISTRSPARLAPQFSRSVPAGIHSGEKPRTAWISTDTTILTGPNQSDAPDDKAVLAEDKSSPRNSKRRWLPAGETLPGPALGPRHLVFFHKSLATAPKAATEKISTKARRLPAKSANRFFREISLHPTIRRRETGQGYSDRLYPFDEGTPSDASRLSITVC